MKLKKYTYAKARVLRPVVSAVPLCPRADTTERLVRSVVSAVPLCPRWIFIVPLYPRADITSRYVRRSVMSADNFRDSLYLEYTPSKTYFNTWFIKIKYGIDVYMTNF